MQLVFSAAQRAAACYAYVQSFHVELPEPYYWLSQRSEACSYIVEWPAFYSRFFFAAVCSPQVAKGVPLLSHLQHLVTI